MHDLFIGCDNDVGYDGARIRATGTYMNSGTCTWSLQTTAGEVVATGSLSYVTGSSGNYLGVIDAAVSAGLTDGRQYRLLIAFEQGGYKDARRVACKASYRP